MNWIKNLKIFSRNVTLSILIKLYLYFQFNFLIKLISFFGGPVFVKVFQTFFNLNNLNTDNKCEGTIGMVRFEDKIAIKKLHTNIHDKFKNSLLFFEYFLKFNNVKYPFNYSEFTLHSMEQLNLKKEAVNSFLLKSVFDNIKNVKIIDIFEYNDTYHKSHKIDAYDVSTFIKRYPKKQNELIYLLHLSYYLMLVSNYFHCDWHYGNFLVNINSNNQVVLHILDTGLMGRFNDKIFDRLKSLIMTDFLFPKRYNVIKFLLFCNSNNNANIKNFIKETSIIKENYCKDIKFIINSSSKNNLKYPVIILYMFQNILFINAICEEKNINSKEIRKFSEETNFYQEIFDKIV